jgi:transcriptional regulator with XRE-family HTH domain
MAELSGLEELAKRISEQGSNARFAEGVGISEPYLSMILSGARPFSRVPVSTALAISQHSGIPIERLAGGAAKPTSVPEPKRAVRR